MKAFIVFIAIACLVSLCYAQNSMNFISSVNSRTITGTISYAGGSTVVQVDDGFDSYTSTQARPQSEWDLIKSYIQSNSPTTTTVVSAGVLKVTFTHNTVGTLDYTQNVNLVVVDTNTKIQELYDLVLNMHQRDTHNWALPVHGSQSVAWSSNKYSEDGVMTNAMNGYIDRTPVTMGVTNAVSFSKLITIARIRVYATQYTSSVTLYSSPTDNIQATSSVATFTNIQPGWNDLTSPIPGGILTVAKNIRLSAFPFSAIEVYTL